MRFLPFLIFISLFGCRDKPNSTKAEIIDIDFKKKYNFTLPTYEEIPKELLNEIYVPYRLGKENYTIANFNGEKVTTKSWNEIIPIEDGFFWGRIGLNYEFILSPDKNIFTKPLTIEEVKRNINIPSLREQYGNQIPKGRTKTFMNRGQIKHFEENKKYGIKNSLGEIVAPALYDKYPAINPDVNAILLKKEGKYGIIDTLGNWILPLEKRKIKLYELIKSIHLYEDRKKVIEVYFQIIEGNQRFIFNQNLTLLGEDPARYFKPFGIFSGNSVANNLSIKFDTTQWENRLLDEFTVLINNETNYLFDSAGNFTSTFSGKYDFDFRFTSKIIRVENSTSHYKAPIGRINLNGEFTYIRLTDGYIYSD